MLIGAEKLELVECQTGVAHVGEGVAERDELCGIVFERVTGELLAVPHEGVHVMDKGNLGADVSEMCRVNMTFFAEDIGGSLGLVTGTLIECLCFEVILVTAQPPIADAVFVQVAACLTEPLDDHLVGSAVVQHLIDLVAEGGR